MTWFKGTTSNDNNKPITFSLPYTYTAFYDIQVQAISTSITSDSTMRTYNPIVFNKTMGTVIIHYYTNASVITNFTASTIGY